MSAPTVTRASTWTNRSMCAFPECTTRHWMNHYCRRHHTHMVRNGIPLDTYAEQAAPKWTNDELMAEWDFMRGWVTFETFGARVGIKQESWEQAFRRAKAVGDPRARRACNDPATWPDPGRWTARLFDARRRDQGVPA